MIENKVEISLRPLNTIIQFCAKLNYKTITAILTLRNTLYSPESILSEIVIKKGMSVLDFGCGPGHFSLAISKIVKEGNVYAVDKETNGLKILAKQIKKKCIKNISIINSDCKIDLPDKSVDIILLYYVFNDLKNQYDVLKELHRVMKPDGRVSFFEFNQNKISKKLETIGFFQLEMKMKKTHTFVKNNTSLFHPPLEIKKTQKPPFQNKNLNKGIISKNNLFLFGVITILGFSIILPWSGISMLADADNDGLIDLYDNCPANPNPDQLDFDFDNTGDECDLDDDNDGVEDVIDLFDQDPSEWSDFDLDSIGDNLDTDDDNDGVEDIIDLFDQDPYRWN